MVYKFNTSDPEIKHNTYLEMSADKDLLRMDSGDYSDEVCFNMHYFHKSEIDDLIVALTNIKNEIVAYERETRGEWLIWN